MSDCRVDERESAATRAVMEICDESTLSEAEESKREDARLAIGYQHIDMIPQERATIKHLPEAAGEPWSI